MLKKLILISLTTLGSFSYLSAIVIGNTSNKPMKVIIKSMKSKRPAQEIFVVSNSAENVQIPTTGREEYIFSIIDPTTGAELDWGGIDDQTKSLQIIQNNDGSTSHKTKGDRVINLTK